MPSFNPSTLKPNWGLFDRRPTWSVVTSAELAQVLNVHLQTINNWKVRGILPAPVTDKKLVGNKNYFRISEIRAWLENKPESDIHGEWVQNHIPYDLESLAQAEYVVSKLYRSLNVEKPLVSANFKI